MRIVHGQRDRRIDRSGPGHDRLARIIQHFDSYAIAWRICLGDSSRLHGNADCLVVDVRDNQRIGNVIRRNGLNPDGLPNPA